MKEVVSLAEDSDWSSLKIKNYNNFIHEFGNIINTTRKQDKKAFELMKNLFFNNEHRTSNEQKIIDRINEIKPLHNATISFSKINNTFEKLKAVASLRLIISKEDTNSDISILNS